MNADTPDRHVRKDILLLVTNMYTVFHWFYSGQAAGTQMQHSRARRRLLSWLKSVECKPMWAEAHSLMCPASATTPSGSGIILVADLLLVSRAENVFGVSFSATNYNFFRFFFENLSLVMPYCIFVIDQMIRYIGPDMTSRHYTLTAWKSLHTRQTQCSHLQATGDDLASQLFEFVAIGESHRESWLSQLPVW